MLEIVGRVCAVPCWLSSGYEHALACYHSGFTLRWLSPCFLGQMYLWQGLGGAPPVLEEVPEQAVDEELAAPGC